MPETIDERIERRKYLKYVGATAIGVAIGYLGGLKYPVKPSTKTFTQTVTETQFETVTERITETVKLASLTGRLFFDYNGDGIQDKNEPAVSKARVYLTDSFGKLIAEAVTDSSGDYKIEDVPSGIYRLNIEADKKFRHMCTSREEVRAVKDGYEVELTSRENNFNIGLMEGYLTLPFAKGTIETSKRMYPDEDPDPHYTAFRDWKGGKDTSNSHPGTDFFVAPNTKIRAAAPGKVMYIDWTKGNSAVQVLHFDGRWTSYAHLGTVEIEYSRGKNPIVRGAVIGTPSTNIKVVKRVHLHFGFSDKKGYIDPYRDLLNPSAISWWTKDNDPQYPF